LTAFLVLSGGLVVFNLPTVFYKLKLYFAAVGYLLFCNDKKWKSPKEDAWKDIQPSFAKKDPSVRTKTVVFFRHGESTWNETFNKGAHRSAPEFALFFFPNLVKALGYEFWLFVTGKIDSWFYDAPLSILGLSQARNVATWLLEVDEDVPHLSSLRNDKDSPPSILISSNLRRALSTVASGFQNRLERNPAEKILVLPCLQEISRNPDTLSITPPRKQVTESWIEETTGTEYGDFRRIFRKQVDMSLHNGNKPLDTNGLKRMTQFTTQVFEMKALAEKEVLIIGGHSLWFRSFFREFLPREFDHISKKKKMVNGGLVAFTLVKMQDKVAIDPDSVKVIYGGFK